MTRCMQLQHNMIKLSDMQAHFDLQMAYIIKDIVRM